MRLPKILVLRQSDFITEGRADDHATVCAGGKGAAFIRASAGHTSAEVWPLVCGPQAQWSSPLLRARPRPRTLTPSPPLIVFNTRQPPSPRDAGSRRTWYRSTLVATRSVDRGAPPLPAASCASSSSSVARPHRNTNRGLESGTRGTGRTDPLRAKKQGSASPKHAHQRSGWREDAGTFILRVVPSLPFGITGDCLPPFKTSPGIGRPPFYRDKGLSTLPLLFVVVILKNAYHTSHAIALPLSPPLFFFMSLISACVAALPPPAGS